MIQNQETAEVSFSSPSLPRITEPNLLVLSKIQNICSKSSTL